MLLEFVSIEAKDRFINLCTRKANLLGVIGQNARFRPRTYPVIFRFVPCNGPFDPYVEDHLCDLERENDLATGSISAASWCKRPDKRSPGQTTATLKVSCVNPDTANYLLKECICITDHLVSVHKDIRQPIRCVKCQEYGHIKDACISIERCATCASEFHSSSNCINSNCPKCVSCSDGSTHPSTSQTCPSFLRKCDALDSRFPENTMPYYPTKERWTWVLKPPNPDRPPPLPASSNAPPRLNSPPPRPHSPTRWQPAPPPPRPRRESQQRQSDNGWPRERRQSTLPNMWGTQPVASSSSQPPPAASNQRSTHPFPSTQRVNAHPPYRRSSVFGSKMFINPKQRNLTC